MVSLEHSTETIAAIATPPGEAGLAVIRISGSEAIAIADRGFRGRESLRGAGSHTAHVGNFFSVGGTHIDEVVITIFRGPHSYTGEDVAEVACHGGSLVTKKILEATISLGARIAEPGEFTKRAFLSGRIDLSQAEAVADLIQAKSERAQQTSLQQLRGSLSTEVSKLRERLIEALGMVELELDFAEDGFEFVGKAKLRREFEAAITQTQELLQSYRTGRIYREGVKTALVGPPNAGKSSLLNALLRENRAIVTEIPGTTRDTIQESLRIEGILFSLVDTAGFRDGRDRAEQEGVRRSTDEVKTSDVILLVVDDSRPKRSEELRSTIKLVSETKRKDVPIILVLNKTDLTAGQNNSEASDFVSPAETVRVSALTGEGLEGLRKKLVDVVLRDGGVTHEGGVTITSERHHDALRRTRESLGLSLQSLQRGESGEFIAVDLRAAMESLGEITGIVRNDEILDRIFSKFCIGK